MGLAICGLCPLIQVFDMPRSLRFYRDVLGFAEVRKSGLGDDVSWAWLRHGEAEVMLNTAYDDGERPPIPDAARVAAHADTILYLGCQDLEGAYGHLVARGVNAERPKVAHGMKQVSATDPDGYGVCLQWPAEESSHGAGVSVGLDHVQLAMPAGGEPAARRFYGELLGLPEVAKPSHLAPRGGVWFEQPGLKLHLGVDADFRPARKAHPGLLVRDLAGLVARLREAGHRVADGEPLDGHEHVYVDDPFGNRLELLEPR